MDGDKILNGSEQNNQTVIQCSKCQKQIGFIVGEIIVDTYVCMECIDDGL